MKNRGNEVLINQIWSQIGCGSQLFEKKCNLLLSEDKNNWF
jgi:hypothetical protein